MRILHTSDWHLGRALYGKKRYEEFAAFLDYLIEVIRKERVDLLLVAGDIFDNSTPGNRAQELYYGFLNRLSGTGCRHTVIVAGNHDSPSFLEAPSALLRTMNIHIIGSLPADPEKELLRLASTGGETELILCAVPYLRDRDIRLVEGGESQEDKQRKLLQAMEAHYHLLGEKALLAQKEAAAQEGEKPPIVAMGHLFAAGGKTLEGDGVRELNVGSLSMMGADSFPPCIDYLALGHLHVPQKVGGREHFRYSGSPLPMGFGEADQQKELLLVELSSAGEKAEITPLPLPCFQPMKRITGDLETILAGVEELKQSQSRAWLELEYRGSSAVENLRDRLEEALEGSSMEALRISNGQIARQVLEAQEAEEVLEELDPLQVFQRCLESYQVPEEERPELEGSYKELWQEMQEA